MKKLPRFAVAAAALLATVAAGCHRHNRLSADTFSFTVTPGATSMTRGATVTLQAVGQSAAGPVTIDPTWTVSPTEDATNTGKLSTHDGAVVQFTAGTALGYVEVVAQWEDRMAKSQIAIVETLPSGTLFNIYTDAGLPTGPDVSADIFTSFDPTAINISEDASSYTPEGRKHLQTNQSAINSFWGVTLDKSNTGLRKDLTSFSAGRLLFYFKIDRVMDAGESFRITLEDNGGQHGVNVVAGANSYGFNRLNTGWQSIVIPLSDFSGVDFAHIKVPFAMAMSGITSPLSFGVDAIRFQN